MNLPGTRFVTSPNGSAIGLPAGEYWAVPDAEMRRMQERIAELQAELDDAWRNDHPITNAEALRRARDQVEFCEMIEGEYGTPTTRIRLAALSRIIRRVLACGQLEKLEDAKPYLAEQGAS